MAVRSSIPLLARAAQHAERQALVATEGTCTYSELLAAAHRAACHLVHPADRGPLPSGARVAFLAPPGLDYAIATWGIWLAGGVAVPLCVLHPEPELEHVIKDAAASLLIAHPEYLPRLESLAKRHHLPLLSTTDLAQPSTASGPLPDPGPEADALILYTSGTTGKPKGVLTTHGILAAQLASVTEAWDYRASDRSLLVLPLHHLHGLLNVLWATLWAGGCCEMQRQFEADAVWERIAAADGLTLFMAVPTIYAKLTASYHGASAAEQARRTAGCQALRLMVCGSAALPEKTLTAFRGLSGHTLLERYGMTEIGMALGNPLRGERRPGTVGFPFPGVEVRISAEDDTALPVNSPGQIQVRGPNVFKAYFRRPEATAEAFTADGFFRTGDMGVCDDEGRFRILGRESVDILKTGGYKVSALEIEACLREHPDIADCAVVGVPDEEWGQRVAAAILLAPGAASLDLPGLREFAKRELAAYKVPTRMRVLSELPRNALGKVQKPAVTALFVAEPGV